MRWWLVVLVLSSCTKFKNGGSGAFAQGVQRRAHATSDATLASYSDALADHRDDYAVYAAAQCLDHYLEGLGYEASLAKATGDGARKQAEYLASSAKHCTESCDHFRTNSLAKQESDDFERKVVDDVEGRCRTRWGEHQEKVNSLAISARLPGLRALGEKPDPLGLARELDQFDKDLAELDKDHTIAADAAQQLAGESQKLRTDFADALARARAFHEDPQVRQADHRLSLIGDEKSLLYNAQERGEHCAAPVGEPEACDDAHARYRLATDRLRQLDAEERELYELLEQRKAAAGLPHR